MKTHPIKTIVRLQKKGISVGIFSVCSANEYVIEASFKRGLEFNAYVLIEATANQVNQYGGYTGMTPKKFRNFVESIAQRVEFPIEKIILGGDHLGPLLWQNLEEEEAMEKAKALVRAYVYAGFTKIHLDSSMKLASDNEGALSVETIAQRGAVLCRACEDAYENLKKEQPKAMQPIYVIGSEVPTPGGALEEEHISITTPKELKRTLESFERAFKSEKLKKAWTNVVAVVVQLGVEFSDTDITEYNRSKTKELIESLKDYKLIFEGHSTDYQTPLKLKEMVEDGIGVLKVGPALTFAFREVLFAMEGIEKELVVNNRSDLSHVLEEAMIEDTSSWVKHYHGEKDDLRIKRKYSFSDRSRYYMGNTEVKRAIKILIKNLQKEKIPPSLISQYMPIQYQKVRQKKLGVDPHELILEGIIHVLDEYYYAIFPDVIGSIRKI